MKKTSQRNPKKKTTESKVIKSSHALPRGAAAFQGKSQAFQEKLTRVANTVSKMRTEKLSLAQASKEFHVSPTTVVRWGRSGLKKAASGRFAAKKSDRIPRLMVVLTAGGKQEIVVQDSKQATILGEHWNTVGKYVREGDTKGLLKLGDKHVVDADGVKHLLLTNTSELNRQAGAGNLSFESIYGRAA